MSERSELPASVIIVEDNALIAFQLFDLLIEEGFKSVGPFSSYSQALANIDKLNPDCCILDLNLGDEKHSSFGPGEEGRRLLAVLNNKRIPTVVYSGVAKTKPHLERLHDNMQIVDKPDPVARVVDALRQLGAKAWNAEA